MKKGFDEIGFMGYLEQTFSGFENSFLRGVVDNLIEYATKHEHVSKDQLCYWMSDLLPEVTFAEVAAFTDDGSLTAWGQNEKYNFKAESL